MPRPVHFEISADDPERALHFYREVFGWQSQKWDGPRDYWLLSTGANDEPGIDGGLALRHPGPPVVNTIEVDSIDAHLAKIASQGGQITQARYRGQSLWDYGDG